MRQRYIMTAFGQDRVGIVADLTRIMFNLGCNLEDSNMTRLSDEFAIIFLFTFSGENAENELSLALQELEREKGITATIRSIPRKRPIRRNLSRPTSSAWRGSTSAESCTRLAPIVHKTASTLFPLFPGKVFSRKAEQALQHRLGG